MTESNESIALAKRFLEALNTCDEDAVREIYHPQARIWHNFNDALQPVEENIKTLRWMHRKLDNLSYNLVQLQPLENGFLQQHELVGTLASGKPFRLLACAICTVENGKITALEEYLDSEQTKGLSE